MNNKYRQMNLSAPYCTEGYFLYYLDLYETFLMIYAEENKRRLFEPGYSMFSDEAKQLMRLINE